MRILVTGGAGFIGSALIRLCLRTTGHHILNLDNLTYASDLRSLDEVLPNERYSFEQGDICDRPLLDRLFDKYQPDAVDAHLAAGVPCRPVDRTVPPPSSTTRRQHSWETLHAA